MFTPLSSRSLVPINKVESDYAERRLIEDSPPRLTSTWRETGGLVYRLDIPQTALKGAA